MGRRIVAAPKGSSIGIDLTGDARLLIGRHLNAEVIAGPDGRDLELHPELLAQFVGGWVVFLAKQAVQLGPHLLDVLRIDLKEALYTLFEAGLELAHPCRQIEV